MKRQLPPHVYRDRGRLIYKRRVGKGWHRVTLETQFPEGGRIPDELYAELLRIKRAPVRVPARYTWKALIAAYKASQSYADKAPRTRKDYDKALQFLERNWGDLDPRKAKRPHFHRLNEVNQDRTKFARDVIAVSSILMGHAIELGWRDDNPVRGMKRPQTPKDKRLDRKPWPPHLIEAFRREAPIGTRARLIFELCLGTGQRIGDVLAMQWQHVDGQGVSLVQRKTGVRLHIPVTKSLSVVLSATERRGMAIVSDRHGRPLSYYTAAREVMKVRKAIGAEAYDIHSLRWTAASELAEAGCSDELIQAITGHRSLSMVAHYTQHVRQAVKAKEARRIQEKRK